MKQHLEDGIRTKRPRGKDKVKDRSARNGVYTSKHLRAHANREREKQKSKNR